MLIVKWFKVAGYKMEKVLLFRSVPLALFAPAIFLTIPDSGNYLRGRHQAAAYTALPGERYC